MVRIIALVIVGLFYVIYLQRQFALRRRGIRVDRLGKGKKGLSVRRLEIVLLTVSLAMPMVQVWSIVRGRVWLGTAGMVMAVGGVVFFLLAVVAMRDNWRAGVDASQKTELVTRGVYRISRNPAFVGFDLFYIGIATMFPNPVLVALTVAGVVVFHLQIVQEERFMRTTFGTDYDLYAAKTRRYL